MKLRFSPKTCEEIGHYVYLYIDPRDGKPFYIGKGCRNRAFAHLRSDAENEKLRKIAALRAAGKEPRIDILKYGLSEREATLVESTAIDLIEIGALTNEVRGHGSKHGSRAEWKIIEQELGASPIDVREPAVLVNVSQTFHPSHSPQQLYDITRSAWKVGPRRERAKYAMAVYRGVIREVYKIERWVQAGSTFNSFDNVRSRPDRQRWEFVGNLAPAALRTKYLGQRVAAIPAGARWTVRYVNCSAESEQ